MISNDINISEKRIQAEGSAASARAATALRPLRASSDNWHCGFEKRKKSHNHHPPLKDVTGATVYSRFCRGTKVATGRASAGKNADQTWFQAGIQFDLQQVIVFRCE